jgi:regulator of sigma E protease
VNDVEGFIWHILLQLLIFLIFVFAFVLVFLVHEAGHFLAAKAFRVRVISFAIGLGRELFRFQGRSGTNWVFRLMPIGGYIRLHGHIYSKKSDELSNIPESEAFRSKPVWQRFLIVLAGPVANLLLPAFLLIPFYLFIGVPGVPTYISGVSVDSAAHEAGFKPGDIVTHMNGRDINRAEQIWRLTRDASGEEVKFRVKRGENDLELNATPRLIDYVDFEGRYKIHGRLGALTRQNPLDLGAIIAVNGTPTNGDRDAARKLILQHLDKEFTATIKNITLREFNYIIKPSSRLNAHLNEKDHPDYNYLYVGNSKTNNYYSVPVTKAVYEAFYATRRIITGTFMVAGDFIGGHILNPDWRQLSPEAAVNEKNFKYYLFIFIHMCCVISVLIGLINLFPVAWADGGYLLLFLIEKPLGQNNAKLIKPYISRLTVAILLGIMLFANLNDIRQLIP